MPPLLYSFALAALGLFTTAPLVNAAPQDLGMIVRAEGSTHDGVQEILSEELSDLNSRYWGEETISNELISGPLLALKVRMLGPFGGASSMPKWEAIFTPNARIAGLNPVKSKTTKVTEGVVKRTWTVGPELLSQAEYAAELEASFSKVTRVRWAQLKPAEVRSTDYGAELVLKYRYNREMSDGGIRHDHGYWHSEWIRDGEEWRCRLLEPKPGAYSLRSTAPHFVDTTATALGNTYHDPRLPRKMAGNDRAIALADLDNDDDLDLIVMNPVRVMYNRGDGTFVDRTLDVLPAEVAQTDLDQPLTALVVGDFDRDGRLDFAAAGKAQPLVLMRQLEKNRFTSHKIAAKSLRRHIVSSLSTHDVDGDGWLDIFVCGYGPFLNPGPNDPTNAVNGRSNLMLRNLMFRNQKGRLFQDVTNQCGLDKESFRWSFIGAFGDADNDGDIDLYVANDFGPNVLYRRDNTEEVYFTAELEDSDKIDAGFTMSATWCDLDNDLDMDMYVSNMSSTAANRVAKMAGDPNQSKRLDIDMNAVRLRMSKGNAILDQGPDGELTEAPESRGAKDASWAWGTAIFDYDCDGDLDIHTLNGYWSQGADDGRDL